MKIVVLVTIDPEYSQPIFENVFMTSDIWTRDNFVKFMESTEHKEKFLNHKYGLIGWTKEIRKDGNNKEYPVYKSTDGLYESFGEDYRKWFVKNYCAPLDYQVFEIY